MFAKLFNNTATGEYTRDELNKVAKLAWTDKAAAEIAAAKAAALGGGSEQSSGSSTGSETGGGETPTPSPTPSTGGEPTDGD